jgi:hypothetical protein
METAEMPPRTIAVNLPDSTEPKTINIDAVLHHAREVKDHAQTNNIPYQINASDIADFYLFQMARGRAKDETYYPGDDTNVLELRNTVNLANATDKLGLKIIASELRLECEEFANWGPDPEKGRYFKRFSELQDNTGQRIVNRFRAEQDNRSNPETTNDRFTKQELFEAISWHIQKLDDFLTQKENPEDIEALRQEAFQYGGNTLYDTLRCFELGQNSERWRGMAALMRTFLFPEQITPLQVSAIGKDVEGFLTAVDKRPKDEKTLRIVDRLVNYEHNNGNMSEKFANDRPGVETALFAHGMNQHTAIKLLLRFASSGARQELMGRSSVLFEEDRIAALSYRTLNPNEATEIVEKIKGWGDNFANKQRRTALFIGFSDDLRLAESLLRTDTLLQEAVA